MYIPFLLLFLNSFFSPGEPPCEPMNKGVKSEDVSTYSIIENDTTLIRKTKIDYNESGLTMKAISASEIDTSVTIYSYDNNNVTKWKKLFLTGTKDTITFIAVKWDEDGRATKLIDVKDKKFYSEHDYKNCRTIHIKRFQDDELFYSSYYEWDDSLLTTVTSAYHGSAKEVIEESSTVTKYEYLFFDEKGNWTTRIYMKGEQQFIEYRSLEYYEEKN